MRFFSFVSVVAAGSAFVQGALISPISRCAHERVAYTTYIGKNKDVKVEVSHCDDEPLVNNQGHQVASLAKRQSSNVCGAPCNTFCWTPAGGPAISDCTVVADALLYESQNTGVLFNITAFGTATNKITMTYDTCLTYFLNQDSSTLTYCRTEWSKLVNWLASDCSAANGEQGGLCVANDQRWYVHILDLNHRHVC